GTKNEREIKRMLPRVEAINALEPEMQKLSDDQLRAKTDEFRARIKEHLGRFEAASPTEPELEADSGTDREKKLEDQRYQTLQEVLDGILEPAFAVVREAG